MLTKPDIDEAITALERHHENLEQRINQSQVCNRTIKNDEELKAWIDEAERHGFVIDRERIMKGGSAPLLIRDDVSLRKAHKWLQSQHQPELAQTVQEATQDRPIERDYIELLRESLDCLLSSCPPKGGRTDLLCRRIKKALR